MSVIVSLRRMYCIKTSRYCSTVALYLCILSGLLVIDSVALNHDLLPTGEQKNNQTEQLDSFQRKSSGISERTSIGIKFGVPVIPGRGRYIETSNEHWETFGRDFEIMHIIAKYTNNIQRVDYVLPFYEKNFTLRQIMNNSDCDIYSEEVHMELDSVDDVEYLYPHAQDKICALVPRAEPMHRSIFYSFTPDVWIANGLFLLAFLIAYRITYRQGISDVFIIILRTLLGGSAKQHRSLMILLCFFSVIIPNAFSGCFTSYLTVPLWGREIDTLEDINTRVDEIYIYPEIRRLISSFIDNDDMFYKLSLKFKLCEKNFRAKLYWFLGSFNVTLIDKESSLSEAISIDTVHFQRWKYRIAEECLVTPGYVTFAVRKGWKYAYVVNRYIQHLVEAGITDHLGHDQYFDLYRFTEITRHREKEPKVLSISNVKEQFLVLCVGLGLSLVVFLLEKWWFFEINY